MINNIKNLIPIAKVKYTCITNHGECIWWCGTVLIAKILTGKAWTVFGFVSKGATGPAFHRMLTSAVIHSMTGFTTVIAYWLVVVRGKAPWSRVRNWNWCLVISRM